MTRDEAFIFGLSGLISLLAGCAAWWEGANPFGWALFALIVSLVLLAKATVEVAKNDD